MVMTEETYFSKVDSYEDRYLIEYPENQKTDLMVVNLHVGLEHAEQGFCEGYQWCFGDLRNEVARRNGVYVSPEYRGDSWMNAAAEADVAALIVDLKFRFKVKKIILAGGSMGGTSALIFASHHMDIIDGLIALCPATDMTKLYYELISREELIYRQIAIFMAKAYGGTPDEVPQEYLYRSSIKHAGNLKMPVVILHGKADQIINISHSQAIVDILKMQGTPIRYDVIQGGDHNSPALATPWQEYLDFVLQSMDFKEYI